MNVDLFAQQVEVIQGRIAQMYRSAGSLVELKPDLLLPIAFKELGTASEELQVAAEELIRQMEELAATRSQLEAQRQRYQDLFDSMPNAYLESDAEGKIQEANRAAARLLNVEQSYLIGKLLINFIPPAGRRVFRTKLAELQRCDWRREWTLCLQPRNAESLDVVLSVAIVRDSQGKLVALRWIVREVTERKRMIKALKTKDYDACPDHRSHFYSKGEVIPLSPQTIWIVSQGLVKLSTISERGEEILVGLVGPNMPFASCMTSLPTYQATVLSQDVQLVSISPSELTASSQLLQEIFPQISQRLRRTELLLAISGRRQVKDRLYHLLLFLKEEIGQPVAQGTRLSVRLTHQDFADACCTTRVTITRLLGKLHKQGKITFDTEHHIILSDES